MPGRVAVVTGVGGEIGRATALEFAKLGAKVCLVDSCDDKLAAIADEVRTLGGVAHAHCADLLTRPSCNGVIEATLAHFGQLNALCNVANAFLPARTVDTSDADWEFSLALNLSAPFYLMQAALPELVRRDGAIVNVTSCAAYTAQPCTAAYTASKAGLLQMTRAIAAEYRDTAVRINLVSPGDLSPHSGSVGHIPDDLDPKTFQKGGYRPGVTPRQVGELIAFLASDQARTFHGSLIPMDNGIGL